MTDSGSLPGLHTGQRMDEGRCAVREYRAARSDYLKNFWGRPLVVDIDQVQEEFDPRFKIFHELMARKVREVLLVSSLYDAWIMEEDCRLSERIVREYRGLNLSDPPRLNWVSTVEEALILLEENSYDMVVIMPRVGDMDAMAIGKTIKRKAPDIPVTLLTHQLPPQPVPASPPFDGAFIWTGNTDILLAIIKIVEDEMNVANDTRIAGIRVIIVVEDSPEFISSLLPTLYKELVSQTQSVMEEGLNDEHLLLAMRARPKVLVADTYEKALSLYKTYHPYVLGVISDVQLPHANRLDDRAGLDLLKKIKRERFDIPLLLLSSDPSNEEKAENIPAVFIDKNSSSLMDEVRSFLLKHQGFGDFVFRMPDGREISRASNLRALEEQLQHIPDESLTYHSRRNDFSRWLFARTEIELASRVRPIKSKDFSSVESHRNYLISIIRTRRMRRQKGVVVNFDGKYFDRDTEFLKIGTGSMGGKARGLAFMLSYLKQNSSLVRDYPQVKMMIPQTLVLTTEVFDQFIDKNKLKTLSESVISDEKIAAQFLAGDFPEEIAEKLRTYLVNINCPLAVRSSSLLEDAQFKAYAGLYKTYMLPNDCPDVTTRLNQLIKAIKLIFASTYFEGPRTFSKRVGQRTGEEKMAVIIQRMVGDRVGDYMYPAVSGVAQSHNFYPFSRMKPEDGSATIALGLGKTVMEGEKGLRFSPRYPQVLPQLSSVVDILKNSQRFFYALKLGEACPELGVNDGITLTRREISEAVNEPPVRRLCARYIPEEHRIREGPGRSGYPVLTFSSILKYDTFPLAGILEDILEMGLEVMGSPVEIEFSVTLGSDSDRKLPEFSILQIRPMSARKELVEVDISRDDMRRAFCRSSNALGNGINTEITDIVYVKPGEFDPARTVDIAREIGQMNGSLHQQERKYLLIGPGRWGTADQWLGIPVEWSNISGAGAIVETFHPLLKVEPSQGSHFFHNITTLGIYYMTVFENNSDFLDWQWLASLSTAAVSKYIAHVCLDGPITLKVDGRKNIGVMMYSSPE